MPTNLNEVPLFRDFSPEELEQIKPLLREKSFEKGEVLNHEGQICERIFIVQEGKLKLCRISSSGREQTLEVLQRCETCACNPGSPGWKCPMTVQAVTPTKIWYLPRQDYARLVEQNMKFSHSLTQLFANRLIRYSTLIEQVSLDDVRKRLVKFLLDMLKKKRGGKSGVLFIPFTRQDLAERLGAARETVARQISELRRKKLIDVKPYQIIIRDQEALENIVK